MPDPGRIEFGIITASGSATIQRVFDGVVALSGIVILSPLLIVLGIAIKLSDGGPVLYRASRVGKDGRLFRLYKFRSMIVEADKKGSGITVSDDIRVTPLGRVLRKYKLDELPQLMNVLKGEMSFVGPRPEDPRYVAAYSAEQRKVLLVRPGITSLASLQFREEQSLLKGNSWESTYVQEILPRKLEIELEYIRRRTILNDVRIIIRTLGGILQ